MRIVGRHDLLPAAGLTVALVVVFSGPVASLLEYTRQIERTRGLQLLPALVILAVVFIFHQLWKRQELRAQSLAAGAAAREATERATDLARLVALGQALARSLDADSIKAAAAAHLPLLLPGRGVWALLRAGPVWAPLLVVGDSAAADREASAARALGGAPPAGDGEDVCFPMVVADNAIGALGVSPLPALTAHQSSMLAAAAALLAVSLKNAELFHDVREDSVRDALTGCFNRSYALDMLDSELRRAARAQSAVSLVMFDLDHFKAINDRHGHLCGDAVLAAVGSRMKAVLRGGDVKCRYGGEEFLILLPDTPASGAMHVAETLRRDIQEHPVQWQGNTIAMSASFGVTTAAPGELDGLAVLARADSALYGAKQSGRNCVRAAGDRDNDPESGVMPDSQASPLTRSRPTPLSGR